MMPQECVLSMYTPIEPPSWESDEESLWWFPKKKKEKKKKKRKESSRIRECGILWAWLYSVQLGSLEISQKPESKATSVLPHIAAHGEVHIPCWCVTSTKLRSKSRIYSFFFSFHFWQQYFWSLCSIELIIKRIIQHTSNFPSVNDEDDYQMKTIGYCNTSKVLLPGKIFVKARIWCEGYLVLHTLFWVTADLQLPDKNKPRNL